MDRVEGAFLVLLHVLRIGERQAFHDDEERLQGAEDPPGLAAHELGRVGVALLRHDRGAGGEGVGEPHEAELRRRPQHDLLGEAREVHGADRGRGERLEHEIAVGDGIERVRGRPVEAERRRGHEAVDRERGAGERRGAERALVEAPARVGEAPAVAGEHLDIGEEMVAEGHRLRRLQMREARHHAGREGERLLGERRLQPGELAVEGVDRVARPRAG